VRYTAEVFDSSSISRFRARIVAGGSMCSCKAPASQSSSTVASGTSAPNTVTFRCEQELVASSKLRGIARRDRDTDTVLTAMGWLVVRVWKHEDPVEAATRLEHVARARES
jgi:hypothetical protein